MMTVHDLNLLSVLDVLQTAHSNGIKYPKLRYRKFKFSLAGAASRNYGCGYWFYDSIYKGKILQNGIVLATLDGPAVSVEEIDSLRPLQNAARLPYVFETERLKTGICCWCGKLLTNETSVSLGIGPICRGKWGF